jgi:hypothetical protein
VIYFIFFVIMIVRFDIMVKQDMQSVLTMTEQHFKFILMNWIFS